MSMFDDLLAAHTRRYFFGKMAHGLGTAALASLLAHDSQADDAAKVAAANELVSLGALKSLHHAPKAKRVIWLFMADAPSQLDLFDYKPKLADFFDKDLPESIRQGQRITTMTSGQSRLPVAPSTFKFAQHGKNGTWLSELLPKLGEVVDDIAIIKTMNTEAINHDPAITYIQTGSQIPGRPSMGAWSSYGLGSENQDLPAYVVLHSKLAPGSSSQALFSRLWGSGFLPTKHQGVALRSSGDPVLYLSNPGGVSKETRRKMLDGLAELNQQKYEAVGDPEITSRIAQYEMAYRMQSSVPELVDVSKETQETLDLYGPEVKEPGTFAYNCLLARRLAERGVRFTQVFLRGWDHHNNLPKQIPLLCKSMDQPAAGLLKDLKQRGMLEDTLVVWGGEFGRTVYSQGTLTKENHGRDHHPRCFTMWMAGAGVKPGVVHGETDDFSYNVVDKPVHIHDLNATILHLMGVNHEQLTYRFQGRDFRLTDVEGHVVKEILT
ncbi:protein of unknown function DUF1501 [Pirellula staleyi DSM 6068]|uniref:Sulfatase n=1 Tax=Pirellula staleyi (strain ATCC 27377 / DSM 6068 / ICPB 4128) TaxID=530564 RepID=D2R6Z5_PIRSD|nr:DUF1501 domain-containing protein [Pirellula staleyi]ADB19198.1 protein of unknown function DUF1501 [Pirellula staleyi DSM 6068]